MIKDVRQDFY